jgi:hypothetical protein
LPQSGLFHLAADLGAEPPADAAGALGIRGSDKTSVHCLLGATYGTGCGLVTDELPLLLNLRDVYWTPEGRWAVDLALAVTAGAGAYFTGIPLWRGLREEIGRARSVRGAPARPQGQHQPGDGDQSGGRLGHRGQDLAGRAPGVLVQVGQRSQRADVDVRVEHHGHHGTA